MTGMSVVTGVHLLAAVVAAATTLAVLLLPPPRRALLPGLDWAAGGTVVWTLCVASVKHEGIHPWHQILWFPAIAFSTGALLLWAGWFAQAGWRPRRPLVAMWLAAPALILAVRLAGGRDVRMALFVANTVYCFALLLTIAVLVARRAGDREPAARFVARFVLVAAVGTLIAEAFRLNVTDLVVTLTLVVVVATSLHAGEDVRARPAGTGLIDDLGALVLVFDAQQRLVEVNAPARLFYEMRGAPPPAEGTDALLVLGVDLQQHDTVSVSLDLGSGPVRLGGYVQRLPSDGAPPNGWVCLLRPSVPSATSAPSVRVDRGDAGRGARRALMGRVPAHDPVTGLLSTRAFHQALSEAARGPDASGTSAVAVLLEAPDPTALADTASVVAASWEGRREAIAAGRYGSSSIGLVVRDLPEPSLRAWCDENGLLDGLLVATRAGSVSDAPALVDEAAVELSRRPRR